MGPTTIREGEREREGILNFRFGIFEKRKAESEKNLFDLSASAVKNTQVPNLWNQDGPFTMKNMAVNRTTEYAVRALVVLALEGGQGRIRQAASLAKASGTPGKFMEQVLRTLKKGGFVVSRRGSGGGYDLAKPPEQIRLGDALS